MPCPYANSACPPGLAVAHRRACAFLVASFAAGVRCGMLAASFGVRPFRWSNAADGSRFLRPIRFAKLGREPTNALLTEACSSPPAVAPRARAFADGRRIMVTTTGGASLVALFARLVRKWIMPASPRAECRFWLIGLA